MQECMIVQKDIVFVLQKVKSTKNRNPLILQIGSVTYFTLYAPSIRKDSAKIL